MPRLMPFRPLFPCDLWFADIACSKGTRRDSTLKLAHFKPAYSGSQLFELVSSKSVVAI